MSKETIIIVLIGVFVLAIGCFIGYIIAKKTKLLDNFSQDSRHMKKVLKDPELLLNKIKESIKQVNPTGEGDLEIWDNDVKIELSVVEEEGVKKLGVKRIKSKAPVVNQQQKKNTNKMINGKKNRHRNKNKQDSRN